MNEEKITNKKIDNILIPLGTDERVQLALGIYADGKRKLLGSTAEESIPEELPGFTGEMHKALVLQGERLKKLELRVESKEAWLVSGQKKKHKQADFQWIQDGKCSVGHLQNWMKIHTFYERAKKGRVGSFEEKLWVSYEILKTSEEELRIVSESRPENAENNDVRCEYWDERKWTIEKIAVGYCLFIMGGVILGNLGSFVAFLLGTFTNLIDNHMVGATGFFFWFVTLFGVIYWTMYCHNIYPSYKRRRASAKVVQHIRQAIPDFCRGAFVSMAVNRIKALLFADTFHQVGEFVNGDVSGFLRTHCYAVNYESQNFWFLSFWQDADSQHIEVLSEALVSEDLGTRVGRRKEYIKVLFVKPVNGIMTHDWYVEKVEVVNRNGK